MFHDDSQKDIILHCSSNKYDVFNVLGTFSFGTLSRSITSVVDKHYQCRRRPSDSVCGPMRGEQLLCDSVTSDKRVRGPDISDYLLLSALIVGYMYTHCLVG